MSKVNFEELLQAGVHFGHLKRKWNPKMAPYIFMERNSIHIIDLHKTVAKLEEASAALAQIAKSGKKNNVCCNKKTSQRYCRRKSRNN
jgi:small subunit ribosomal protein S2